MDSQLRKTLAEVFGVREAEINNQLKKEDLGSWDSLKQMDLVMTLEREYNIILEMTDIIRMLCVAGIISVLEEKGVIFGN